MAALYKVTNHHAAWTWLQATFFLWAILQFIWYFFRGRGRPAAAVLLLACPLILCYSVFWEMSVVASGALLCLLVLDDRLDAAPPAARKARWGLTALYGLLAFVIVGFRINAATAVAGLCLWGLLRAAAQKRADAWRAVLPRVAAAAAGLLAALSFPRMIGTDTPTNMAYGFFWESLCMVDEIGEGGGYDTYYDDLLGEGATKAVFEAPQVPIGRTKYLTWDSFYLMTYTYPDQVYARYLRLAASHPRTFLKVKAAFIANDLFYPLREIAIGYQADFESVGLTANPRRGLLLQILEWYMERIGWLRTPWLVFALAAGMALLARRTAGEAGPVPKWLFVALCYYGAFFITSQNFEYRYFFPADLILVLAGLLSLSMTASALGRRYQQRRGGPARRNAKEGACPCR